MKISARNQWQRQGHQGGPGSGKRRGTLTIAPGVEVVAVISTASADVLALAPGKAATAMVKASSVLVATD